MMGTDEATLAPLRQLRSDHLDPAIAACRGRIVKSMGDGWLAEFPGADDAVSAAMRIQDALAGHPRLALRIGIHVGDIAHDDGDIFGDGVNIADRLATEVESVLQRAPFDARILAIAGWACLWSGKPDRGPACFETALRVARRGPNYLIAAGSAATACVQLGRDREAIAHAEAGLALSETCPALHSTRAAAHAMLGEADKAAAALRKAGMPEQTATRSVRRVHPFLRSDPARRH